nr:hypothetical protein Iba_chr13fCG2240 [Ipomoea batatas]
MEQVLMRSSQAAFELRTIFTFCCSEGLLYTSLYSPLLCDPSGPVLAGGKCIVITLITHVGALLLWMRFIKPLLSFEGAGFWNC